jgi:hypothetical protein
VHLIEQPPASEVLNCGIIDHHDPDLPLYRENARCAWLRTQVNTPPVAKTFPDQSND